MTLALASVTTDQPHKRRVLGPRLTGRPNSKQATRKFDASQLAAFVLAEDIHGKGHVSPHPKEGQRMRLSLTKAMAAFASAEARTPDQP